LIYGGGGGFGKIIKQTWSMHDIDTQKGIDRQTDMVILLGSSP